MKSATHNLIRGFGEFINQHNSPATVAGYVMDVRQFADWFEQSNGYELTAASLTQTDVREYRQHLIQRNRKPNTINRHIASIRALAEFLGIAALDVRPVATQPIAPRWLDKLEQAALLRAAEKEINAATTDLRRANAMRDRAIIVALLNTGLRISELCSLKPESIAVNERSGSVMVTGKGSKVRMVPLNREARAAFAQLKIPFGLRPWRVQYMVALIGRRAGIEVSPHVLRHTFAKNMMDAGVSIDRVAALLGHSNLNTTRIYTTPGEKDLQMAVETLE